MHVSVGAATLTLVTITIINEFIVLKQFLYTGEKKRLYQSIRWHGKSSVLIIFGVPVLIWTRCVFFSAFLLIVKTSLLGLSCDEFNFFVF